MSQILSEETIYVLQWLLAFIWFGFLVWPQKTPQANQSPSKPTLSKPTIIILGIIFLGSAAARLLFDFQFHAPTLRREEIVSSILYPMTLFGNLKTYSGLTQLSYASILHGYHLIFGFDIYDARLVATGLSVVSTILAGCGVHRLFGLKHALTTSLFLLLSLTVFGYATQSTEISWSISAVALCFFIYSFKRSALWWQLVFGISLALSCLTYPSFVIALFSLALATVLVEKKNALNLLRSYQWVIVSSVLVLASVSVAHLLLYSETTLFKGGGAWIDGVGTYFENVLVLLLDVFLQFKSYNSPHMAHTFVEPFLFPFFVFGIWSAKKNANKLMLVCAWTVLLIFLITALASAYPGMRRGITLLFFFYLVAGYGFCEIKFESPFKTHFAEVLFVLTMLFQVVSLHQGYHLAYITEKYLGNYIIESADFKNLVKRNYVALGANETSDLDKMYLEGLAASSDTYNKTQMQGKYKTVVGLADIAEMDTQGQPVVLFFFGTHKKYWEPVLKSVSSCVRRFENMPYIPTWGQPFEIWQVKDLKSCLKK